MFVLNLVARILVILAGLAAMLQWPPFDNSGIEPLVHRVFGAIVILYGCYRVTSFLTARRRND